MPYRLAGADGTAFGGPSMLGQMVWVRSYGTGGPAAGEQVVIVYLDTRGPVEIARHLVTTPGNPRVEDGHFPPAAAGPINRVPTAKNPAESAFLDLGEGAVLWLKEAAAVGTSKMRVKMAQAVELSRLFDPRDVDWALGHAAVHGRFAEADVASILDHHAQRPRAEAHRAGEERSLAQGTTGWAALGRPPSPAPTSPPTPAQEAGR